MRYLMIENKGVAPVTAFTVFGATTKRNSGIPGLIGTFGSGGNMGTLTLLRQNIPPVIALGNTKLEFFSEYLPVEDVVGNRTAHDQVCVKFSGTSNKTEKLSWTTAYGSGDWKDIALALREFVSNAIDAMLTQGVNLLEVWDSITIKMVDKIQAKAGYTRVFVPAPENTYQGDEVEQFLDRIDRWFLHAAEADNLKVAVLEKNGRNVRPETDANNKPILRACIYRRGVFVREFESSDRPSLFDYNIDNLPIDESRTVDDHAVLNAAGRALKNASPEILTRLFNALDRGKDVWEAGISSYSMLPSRDDDVEAIRRNWQSALNALAGERATVTQTKDAADRLRRKGFAPVMVPEAFMDAARALKVRTSNEVLTADERAGREILDPTPALTKTVDRVWKSVVKCGMTNGKEKPKSAMFWEQMVEGSEIFGFYREDTVFAHRDYAGVENDALDLTVLEEVAHHCSGAGDNSRDFQQWLLRFLQHALKK